MIIYFLTIFIRLTITFEYNDDDDDDNEKQLASQSCKYYIIFYCLITTFHFINIVKWIVSSNQ